MLACLQGTFRCKPKVASALHGLLKTKLLLSISLTPSDRSNQHLRLQVFLNEPAFQENSCGASGKLLDIPIRSTLCDAATMQHVRNVPNTDLRCMLWGSSTACILLCMRTAQKHLALSLTRLRKPLLAIVNLQKVPSSVR